MNLILLRLVLIPGYWIVYESISDMVLFSADREKNISPPNNLILFRLAFIPGVWIVWIRLWYGLIQRWPLYQEKNISPPNESHSLQADLYTWILDSADPSLMWVLSALALIPREEYKPVLWMSFSSGWRMIEVPWCSSFCSGLAGSTWARTSHNGWP